MRRRSMKVENTIKAKSKKKKLKAKESTTKWNTYPYLVGHILTMRCIFALTIV